MSTSTISSAVDANESANEEIDETTPLLENGSRTVGDRVSSIGTERLQNNKRHVCCIYISGFLSFAIFFALIFGLRFGPDLEMSLNQDTHYSSFFIGEYAGGFNGVLTITNTYVQTIYLIILHDGQHNGNGQAGIKLMFYLLSINNLGFWMVDSLAQARYPPFTYSLKSFYNDTWWKIFNKIVFPFFIFYRFKAALFFFESWCSKEETDHYNREPMRQIEETSVGDNTTRTRRQSLYDQC
ncbi:uncharacterized protein LOC134271808 [Saccostrea cucullata]|uniref:uncharacterized protein LOC134271808 n=1 Tax=Saccostrea cuccullata TaxID=36930 RepID=UPI002ED0EA00